MYLFLRNADNLEGEVYLYDESWNILEYDDDGTSLTSSLDLAHLKLRTLNNRIYAAFIDGSGFGGSTFSVAIYQ